MRDVVWLAKRAAVGLLLALVALIAIGSRILYEVTIVHRWPW